MSIPVKEELIEEPFIPSHPEQSKMSCDVAFIPVKMEQSAKVKTENEIDGYLDNPHRDLDADTTLGELKPLTCKLCSKTFPYISKLTEHMRFHNKEKLFNCSICEKSFFTQSNVNKHIKEIHQKIKPVAKHACSLCSKTFTYNSRLVDHMRTHLKEKSVSCYLCEKKFYSQSNVNKHINEVHRKLKLFACTLCDKSFATRPHLETHVDGVHKKLNLYACTLCDKSFSVKSNLNAHMSRHVKVELLECDQCEKQFSSKKGLNYHVDSVHKQLRPFCCQICGRSFATNKILTGEVTRKGP